MLCWDTIHLVFEDSKSAYTTTKGTMTEYVLPLPPLSYPSTPFRLLISSSSDDTSHPLFTVFDVTRGKTHGGCDVYLDRLKDYFFECKELAHAAYKAVQRARHPRNGSDRCCGG